jgi:hypothetical protein
VLCVNLSVRFTFFVLRLCGPTDALVKIRGSARSSSFLLGKGIFGRLSIASGLHSHSVLGSYKASSGCG